MNRVALAWLLCVTAATTSGCNVVDLASYSKNPPREHGYNQIVGRVTTASGEGVRGVRVSVRVAGHADHPETLRSPFDFSDEMSLERLATAYRYLKASTREAVSDRDGRFSIHGIPAVHDAWTANHLSHRVQIYTESDDYFVFERIPPLLCADNHDDTTHVQRLLLPETLDLVAVGKRKLTLALHEFDRNAAADDTTDSASPVGAPPERSSRSAPGKDIAPPKAIVRIVRCEFPELEQLPRLPRVGTSCVVFVPPVLPWEVVTERVWTPENASLEVPCCAFTLVVHSENGSGYHEFTAESKPIELSLQLKPPSLITSQSLTVSSLLQTLPETVLEWPNSVTILSTELPKVGQKAERRQASQLYPWQLLFHPQALREPWEVFAARCRALLGDLVPPPTFQPPRHSWRLQDLPMPWPTLTVRPADLGINGHWAAEIYALPKQSDSLSADLAEGFALPASSSWRASSTRQPATFHKLPHGPYWLLAGTHWAPRAVAVVEITSEPQLVELAPLQEEPDNELLLTIKTNPMQPHTLPPNPLLNDYSWGRLGGTFRARLDIWLLDTFAEYWEEAGPVPLIPVSDHELRVVFTEDQLARLEKSTHGIVTVTREGFAPWYIPAKPLGSRHDIVARPWREARIEIEIEGNAGCSLHTTYAIRDTQAYPAAAENDPVLQQFFARFSNGQPKTPFFAALHEPVQLDVYSGQLPLLSQSITLDELTTEPIVVDVSGVPVLDIVLPPKEGAQLFLSYGIDEGRHQGADYSCEPKNHRWRERIAPGIIDIRYGHNFYYAPRMIVEHTGAGPIAFRGEVPACQYVRWLKKGGPLFKDGLRVGDKIVACNGKRFESIKELQSWPGSYLHSSPRQLALTVIREGEAREVVLEYDAWGEISQSLARSTTPALLP